MVIKKTIKKEDIKEMPKVLFPGRIHLVQTPWGSGKSSDLSKKLKCNKNKKKKKKKKKKNQLKKSTLPILR